MIQRLMILALACSSFMACNSGEKSTEQNANVQLIDSSQGLWSIKAYLDDQWILLQDAPLVLLKTVEQNGKVDSSYLQLDEKGFAEIRAFFDKTDINDSKMRNLYSVEEFSDFGNAFIFLNYKALDPELLTQKVELGINDETMKIKTVFIETRKSSLFKSEIMKLNYNSNKSIVIQQDIKKMFSDPERIVTKYLYEY